MSYKIPNHTQTPNELFDIHMRDMDMAELKVTLAICRKTFGWHKRRDKISLSQLEELTGMSRTSVIKGVQKGIGRGTIERFASDDGFEYGLVTEDASTENVPLASTDSVHTKESNIKEKELAKDFNELASSKKPHVLIDYPIDVMAHLKVFIAVSGIKPIKSQKGDWIKTAREWMEMGIPPVSVRDMYKYAVDKEWGVARPGSITKAFHMMQTKPTKEQPVKRY